MKKNNIAEKFEEYLKNPELKEYYNDYIKSYKEAQKNSEISKTDFIYYKILGFNKGMDILEEYFNLYRQRDDYIKVLQQEEDDLIEKFKGISNDKKHKYEKSKLKFYKNIIDNELKDTKNYTKEKLIKIAWINCTIPSYLGMLRTNFLNGIYSVKNIYSDKRNLVFFGDLPTHIVRNLISLKNTDQKKYIESFKDIINSLKVLEKVERVTKKNYYIHDRLVIISEALSFFSCGKYLLFVYLIVPQIEGLFKVLKESIMFNNLDSEGMKDLAVQINKIENFKEFEYFAFDFPKLRNNIVHGDIVAVDVELACEVMMVLYWSINKIDSEEHDYKNIMLFLEDFYDKKNMEDLVNSIEKYFTLNNNKKYIRILRRYFEGKFDSMLKWYGFEKKQNKFSEIINKCEFYLSLWNDDPLEIGEVIEVIKEDGVKKKEISKKPNDASCKYADFLVLLNDYVYVPSKWYQDYKLFLGKIKQIEQSNKNRIKQLNKNKHLN